MEKKDLYNKRILTIVLITFVLVPTILFIFSYVVDFVRYLFNIKSKDTVIAEQKAVIKDLKNINKENEEAMKVIVKKDNLDKNLSISYIKEKEKNNVKAVKEKEELKKETEKIIEEIDKTNVKKHIVKKDNNKKISNIKKDTNIEKENDITLPKSLYELYGKIIYNKITKKINEVKDVK